MTFQLAPVRRGCFWCHNGWGGGGAVGELGLWLSSWTAQKVSSMEMWIGHRSDSCLCTPTSYTVSVLTAAVIQRNMAGNQPHSDTHEWENSTSRVSKKNWCIPVIMLFERNSNHKFKSLKFKWSPSERQPNLSPSTGIIVHYKHLSQPQGHGWASEYNTNMTRDDYRGEFNVKAQDDCFYLFIFQIGLLWCTIAHQIGI